MPGTVPDVRDENRTATWPQKRDRWGFSIEQFHHGVFATLQLVKIAALPSPKKKKKFAVSTHK